MIRPDTSQIAAICHTDHVTATCECQLEREPSTTDTHTPTPTTLQIVRDPHTHTNHLANREGHTHISNTSHTNNFADRTHRPTPTTLQIGRDPQTHTHPKPTTMQIGRVTHDII